MSSVSYSSISASALVHSLVAIAIIGSTYFIVDKVAPSEPVDIQVIELKKGIPTGTITAESQVSKDQSSGIVMPKLAPIPKIETIVSKEEEEPEAASQVKKVNSGKPTSISSQPAISKEVSHRAKTPSGAAVLKEGASPAKSSVKHVGFNAKDFVKSGESTGIGDPAGLSSKQIQDAHPSFFQNLTSTLHDATDAVQGKVAGSVLKIQIRIKRPGVISEVKVLSGSKVVEFQAGVISALRGLSVDNVPDDVFDQWISVNIEVD